MRAACHEFRRRGHLQQKDRAVSFRGYQPAFQANDCITLARNGRQDRLICITGHLESGVAEMVFTRDFSKRIDVSLNYFVRAEDSIGAHGANVVECKESSVYFGLAKLAPGPRPDAVAVDIAHAEGHDPDRMHQGLPAPEGDLRRTRPRRGYVPPGHEKNARFVIDLATSKTVPEAEFGRP